MLFSVLASRSRRVGAPVLYHQNRVGKDGRVFRVLKFRSMKLVRRPTVARWA